MCHIPLACHNLILFCKLILFLFTKHIILLCCCYHLRLYFSNSTNVLVSCYVDLNNYTLILFCNDIMCVSINYNVVVCSIILHCLITLSCFSMFGGAVLYCHNYYSPLRCSHFCTDKILSYR